MGSSQQFSLRWNNYLKHITCAFDTLRSDEDLVDVTLSCEGKRIRAHKMLLSACSTYFRDLFKENPCQHPVIIFRNVKFDDLAALVDFMYQGEVNVVQEQLASFLTTAELLAVQGLTDGTGKDSDSLIDDDTDLPNEPEVQLQNSPSKLLMTNPCSKSPSSPAQFSTLDLQSETPPNKRRKCRDGGGGGGSGLNADKLTSGNTTSSMKELDRKNASDNNVNASSDSVEIIPLMPNLKLEMPEYLEQDGSSCSYEEQSAGESSANKVVLDDIQSDINDHDQKPDIGHSFYSTNQSTSDTSLDMTHQSTDQGHLLSKPSTSGERLSQEAVQDSKYETATTTPSSSSSITTLTSAATTTTVTTSVGNQLQTSFSYDVRRRSKPLHDESGRWVCDVCGKTYNRGDSLAHHRSIHRGDTVCPICQAVFTRKYTMRCHLVNVHGIK